jgi:N-glycosylase/DNA lyase
VRFELPVSGPLDLEVTFTCGQAFRWVREGEGWSGVVGGAAARVWPGPRATLLVEARGAALDRGALVRYFRLDEDPRAHLAGAEELLDIPGFSELLGLRLLRQDPWETLITFICSAAANVRKIRGCVEGMTDRWGEPIPASSRRQFPTPARLARAREAELRTIGLGFRAPYVRETARRVAARGFDWDPLRSMEYGAARSALMELPGVGRKIADCTLLFGLDRLEAWPVDRWIRRATRELSARRRARDEELERWAERLGPGRGYLQQVLFHLRRTGGPLPPLSRAAARRRTA